MTHLTDMKPFMVDCYPRESKNLSDKWPVERKTMLPSTGLFLKSFFFEKVQFCSRFDATRWHISVVVTKPRYFDNPFFLNQIYFLIKR